MGCKLGRVCKKSKYIAVVSHYLNYTWSYELDGVTRRIFSLCLIWLYLECNVFCRVISGDNMIHFPQSDLYKAHYTPNFLIFTCHAN